MFEECRLEGEFVTSSGKKSPYYYDFDLLSSEATMEYAAKLVALLPPNITDEVDFVASPILGGVEIAFVIAGALGKPRVKVLTVEERTRGPVFEGKKYLLVDDVVSSGQAVSKVINILSDNTCIGIAALVFRGPPMGSLPLEAPSFFLERKESEI